MISVFNSPKRNKISASTRLMYKFVKKIEIIKKNLLHISSFIRLVFRVTLIWVKCYISAVFSALLLSTCLIYSFFYSVFSILSNLMDFPLKREPKQTFYWYWSFYEIGTILFHISMFRLNRNSSSNIVKTNKNEYSQKRKRYQITSKEHFARKWNYRNYWLCRDFSFC